MRIFKKKKRCSKYKLRKYPCDTYLRNALYFIENEKPNDAYTEICWAIVKSGGELAGKEKKKFNELCNKE